MENVNGYFAEFAEWFIHGDPNRKHEVVKPECLDRAALDYSVESLKAVDRYLDQLHGEAPGALRGEWVTTVLRCGAYVGEVIARSSDRSLYWVDFDELVKCHPDAKRWLGEEAQLETRAILTTADFKFMTAPLNKVIKFIVDGSADSVWFYAAAMLSKSAKADQ